MITTNLTLTNGVTSETPIQVTGITFEAGTKLAVNPATTFPFTIAIDSSVVVGIDFDETVNTGSYTEEIIINTLGGRRDIVHTVNMVDTSTFAVVTLDGTLSNTDESSPRYLINLAGNLATYRKSKWEEELNIPTYDSGNPEHIIVTTTNFSETLLNNVAYTNFYIEAGDYSATEVAITSKGISTKRRTLSLHDGGTTHPFNLADNIQANTNFSFDGAEYWDFNRISELDDPTAETTKKFTDSSNNRFNQYYIRNYYYGWFLRGTSSNNLWQYMYMDMMIHNGRINDNVGWALADETKTNLIHNNKLILSDFRNSGDAFQALMNGTDWGFDYQGTVVDRNVVWIDSEIYSDAVGNYDPSGGYHVGEDGMDIKAGSLNPDNPMTITNNLVYGFNNNATIGAISQEIGAGFVYHFTAQNIVHEGNITWKCGQAFGAQDGRDYSGDNPDLFALRDASIRNNIASEMGIDNPADYKPYVFNVNICENINISGNTVSAITPDSSGGATSFWLSSENVNTPLFNNVALGAETDITDGGMVAYNNIQDASLASLSSIDVTHNVANITVSIPYAESSLGGATTYRADILLDSGNNIVATTNKSTLLDAVQTLDFSFSASNYVRYYKEDELVEIFTVGQTSLSLTDGLFRDLFVSLLPPDMADIEYMKANPELSFRHFNASDSFVDSNIVYPIADCLVYAPLGDLGETQINYRGVDPIVNGTFTDTLDPWYDEWSWWEWVADRAHHPFGADLQPMTQPVDIQSTFFVTFTVEVLSGTIKLLTNTDGAGQDLELFSTDTSGTYTVQVDGMGISNSLGFARDVEGEFFIDDVFISGGGLIAGYTALCDSVGHSSGLQLIASHPDMTDADTMGFDSTQSNQEVIAVPLVPHSALEVIGGVTHLYTNDLAGGLHYYIGAVEQAVPTEIVGFFNMNDVSEISGLAVSERELFEIYDGIKVAV